VNHGLEALLGEAVREGAFPLCRAEVLYQGRPVFSGGNAPAHTHFDLASLTKVVATTALLLDPDLDLTRPVRDFLPTAVVDATLDDLLFHRSGLPAFEPFFAPVLLANPELASAEAWPALRARVAGEVLEQVLAVHPVARPGAAAVYSDLGFILLGAVLEVVHRAPLDELFLRRVARPLRLGATYRRLSHPPPLPTALADTGTTRPREPAPGQEGLWRVPPRPAERGQVDDDNAFCLDGVSGHAGLFGTALDVAHLGQAVLEGELAPPTPWGRDATPGSTRARGFDTPSAVEPSCGPRFGRDGRRGALGHLGFTGTSLWIDLDRRLVVALLTNRVALGRANLALKAFRPRFHEAVLEALGLE
jgi:CubicO group peptidase (beta-lactamase class C family)